jgi:hypothetical protein
MAEFKLGRIRFVWQGDWSADRTYVADDVVSFGGKSYICIRNHTSTASFQNDFDSEIKKWDIVSDGTAWQGDWEPEFSYAPGDVVRYGAIVYIAETGHVSATFESPDFLGLEADLDKWTPFATSFDWKSDWETATRYKINDLVRYGGFVYLCNTAHVSAATVALGLENDQGKWTLFSDGLVYLGEWVTENRYRLNDVVKYGGNVFICTTPHTSNDFISDEVNWDVFIEGFQFEDSWNNSTVYQIGDTITYGGYVYVAKTNNTNAQPTASPDDWEVFTTGFAFQGDWSSLDSYKVGDVVRLGGNTYVGIADSLDQEPPNDTYWSRLNSGINWTRSVESFSQVAGTNAAGQSGSGARFDVVKSNTVYTVSVSTGFTGTGYAENDVITLSGADVGGTTPANDIVVTVTGVTAGAVDSITHTGFSSSWIAGKDYHVGDVVIYGASSFICVTKNTSETDNRPDNDTEAVYWNILTIGSEALSLEVSGDMVYYGNNGPTRLPIGVDGQILRATDGFPEWANYGLIDNVVYVGPLGTDIPAPESGLTIDKPFASVRYALDQIRNGYLNPKTRDVLRNNKQFLIKEASEWVKYNYNVQITASASGTRTFTCNSTENLRDGIPFVFSGDVFGGVTAGTTYYIDAIISSTEFRISDTQGGISIILTDDTGTMEGNASVNFDNLEADCARIVDGIIYDVSRGGTLKTTTATNLYYVNTYTFSVESNNYVSQEVQEQKTINQEVYTKLKDIIDDVVNNRHPVNYQALNDISVEDRAQQVLDLDLVAEDRGKEKAGDLLDIVVNGIVAGSNTAIALPVLPNTTVFIKTGTYNEVLPMILPEYTAVVGDELRTSVVQPRPAIAKLANDKNKTTSALNRIKDLAPKVIQNIEVEKTAGNTAIQQYVNGYGGTTTTTNRLNNGIEKLSDILEKGLTEVDLLPNVGPVPTSGSNNASDSGFANAIAQIEANVDFIVAEQTAWIQAQVDGEIAPFASDFTFDTANCERDTRYILDALRYDLTYGGNLETTVAARSYFVDGNPVYGTGKKEETLATYAHLKLIVSDIIIEAAITPTVGNDVTQNTDGDAGSAAAETFADTRIQEIYDTIDTDGTLPTPVLPDTSWVDGVVSSVVSDFVAVKADIQSGAIEWVNENYPTLDYNQTKCERDVGYFVDALEYDILFGSTFRSTKAGMSYRRAISSAEVVIDSQLEPTIGTVDYTRDRIKYYTTRTAKVDESTDLILDILENGSGSIPSSYTYTDPAGYDTGFLNARRLISVNKDFIVSEIDAFMTDNYGAFWVALDSDSKAQWLEDLDEQVEALKYDLTYRGNLATIIQSRLYYDLQGAFVRGANEKTESLAAQQRLIDIISDIALGTLITKSTSNADTQDNTGTAGSAGAAAFAQDRAQEIYESADSGLEPALISPSTAWTDAALQDLKTVLDSRSETIQLAATDYIDFLYPTLDYDTSLCQRDVGYMIDGIGYDVIFDSNYLTVQNAIAYRRGTVSTELVLSSQLQETLSTIRFVNSTLTEITKGVVSDTGTRAAGDAAFKLVKDMNTIIQNGLEALPPISYPTAPGYNTADFADTAYATTSNTTGATTTYGDAADQIVANYEFIQDEVRKWLEDSNNGYDVIWGSITPDGQDRCIRDVGYILDAVRYDLTYGGNTQSLIAGSAYYSNFVLTISAAELPATLAAYARLKEVVEEVIAETTVTTSPGVTEVQDTSGTPGNTSSIEFAGDRIDDVLDYINNANPNDTIEIANSWQQKGITKSYNRIKNRKDEIVEDVVFYVEKFHQELQYNQDTCRRDAALMVDAIARDLYTGSNFATTKAGMSYYRLIASALEVVNNELYATVNSVEFLAQKIRKVATVSANASIDLLITDITSFINGGKVPINKWVIADDSDTADVAAASIIWENKAYIVAEVIAFLDDAYPELTYNKDKCRRDTGMLVDAVRYDLTYGSNYATQKFAEFYYQKNFNEEFEIVISTDEKAATLAAYDYAKQILTGLAVNDITSPGAIQNKVTVKSRDSLQLVGDAGSLARVEELLTDVYNSLEDLETQRPSLTVIATTDSTNALTTDAPHGLVEGSLISFTDTFQDVDTYYVKEVLSSTQLTISTYFGGPVVEVSDQVDLIITGYSLKTASVAETPATLKQQFTNLSGSIAAIKGAVTDFINDKYPTLDYDVAKCERDVGYIVEAVGRDMMSNSNYLTQIASQAYFRGTQADKVLGDQKNATVQSYRELKNVIATYISGVDLAKKRTNALMDIIINMLDKGNGNTPEIHGTVTYFNDKETINAVDILKANKNFLANEATAWITASFGGTVTDIEGSPGTIRFANDHNLIVGDPIVFDDNAFGDLVAGQTYYVVNVTDTSGVEISDEVDGEALVLDVASGSSVALYDYDPALCRRDMERYIEAIVYDLQYPGNHKSWKAAELYLNAVNGSEKSDMYHVRNATGVRNQTVNGLRGNLTELNDFGTRRPTAGAYVSLDPGFGPNDTEAWVTNKSCYVQNVSTFGVGCVGCKIDGAIHSGGNRSIVSNDFTQILSDGIGVWCSGNNSLTELVSVFAYYNYSGYLADFGGRIRATNGNSSYGTYGVIAEGTDTGEEPITATIDNLSQDAIIYGVPTDGEEEVLGFEFANVGTGYTNAEVAISGTGFNAAVKVDEFRDRAVVETRIIDLNDGNGIGGSDYITAQNVAQGGSAVHLQLAATDFALSTAYVGMNAQITAGTGVGQYAKILAFNNGTKNATVYKPSIDPFTITGTTASTDIVTITGNYEQLSVNDPVYVAEAVGGLDAGTTPSRVYYVITNNLDGTIQLSDEEGGAAVTLTTTVGQSVKLYVAGWDNVIPGKLAEVELNLTTGYTIEPSVHYTEPGFTTNSSTTADAIGFDRVEYALGRYVAFPNNGTQTNYSLDGKTWIQGGVLPATGNWSASAYGGGDGAIATAIVGGLGGSGAVLEAELGEINSIGLPGPTQIARINVINGGTGFVTAPTIVFTSVQGGGGASAVATVKDGSIQSIIITSTGAGYAAAPTVTAETDRVTEIIVNARGRGYLSAPTVTLSGGGASTQAQVTAITENQGVTIISIDEDEDNNPLRGSGYTSAPTVTITDTDAKWVAIAPGSINNAYLLQSDAANAVWTVGNPLPNSGIADIAYGNGTWTVVGGAGGTGSAGTSTDGITWVSRTNTTPAAGDFVSVAYGSTRFVAINDNGFTSYSSNGITWTAGGSLPGTETDWKKVVYGNGRFVAISSSGDQAISYDFGENWFAGSTSLANISSNPNDWETVEYGQGLFLASGSSGGIFATSQDGVIWTDRTIGGTAGYAGIAFGNTSNTPLWVAVTGSGSNDARWIETGARPNGRTYVDDDNIVQFTLREPGSGFPEGNIVSTTAPNTIEVDTTSNLFIGQPITFDGSDIDAVGLDSEVVYYISDIPTSTTIEVSLIKGSDPFDITSVNANNIGTIIFQAGPSVTIGDPNATVEVAVNPRIRSGTLAQPSFTNRGAGYTTATAELGGDGNADLYQPSTFISLRGLFELPEPGSNVVFDNILNRWYKLVTISNVIGQPGEYTATFQISPGLNTLNAPKDGTKITTTNKYSQVRLTGHDFLYIGTGNQAKTNYPFVDITTASIDRQQLSSGGGRVFFTSTDQDGNFNVGGLFGVQQSTGTATLDADAFNLAGLQSLQLGGIAVGIGSAIITQFSTDPFFTENSDSIVPTQRAIKSYITAQIGGGQSSLNVNTLTAGVVFIANDEITTTSGGQLNIKAKMNFTGGIDGAPVALGYFLSR